MNRGTAHTSAAEELEQSKGKETLGEWRERGREDIDDIVKIGFSNTNSNPNYTGPLLKHNS